MNKDRWPIYFERATEAYVHAVYSGATLSSSQREIAIKDFLDWSQEFKEGGTLAVKTLENELESKDTYRRNTAARMLIGSATQDRLKRLSRNIVQDGHPKLSSANLRQLWVADPPSPHLLKQFARSGRPEWRPLLLANLFRPTDEAYKLFSDILAEYDQATLHNALLAIANWKDAQLLWKVIEDGSKNRATLNDFGRTEIRVKAAFFLGLRGDTKAIAFLEDMIRSDDHMQVAKTCRYLSWLALPSVLAPLTRLLENNNPDVVALALNATTIIRSAMLLPSILKVARRKEYNEVFHSFLCDEAIIRMRTIIGEPLMSLDESFVIKHSGSDEFTEAYRREAILRSETAIRSFDLSRRYYNGKLLTLSHLAEDLLSPHSLPTQTAIYNLRAITGEDYGFDPEDDIITNFPAIMKWKARAEKQTPLEPGGWAFGGISMSPS